MSALIAFTEKGKEIVEGLKDVTLVEHPFEVVAEGQMKKNAKHKELTPLFMAYLRNGFSLTGPVFKLLFFSQRVITKLKTSINVLC